MPRSPSMKTLAPHDIKSEQSRNWEFVLLRCATSDFPLSFRANCNYCSWSYHPDQFGTYSLEGYIQFPSIRRKNTLQAVWRNSVWTKAYRSPIYVQSALRHPKCYGVINPDKRHWLVPKLVIEQPCRQSQDQLLDAYVDAYRQERDAYCRRLSDLLVAAENPPSAPIINDISNPSPHIFFPSVFPCSNVNNSSSSLSSDEVSLTQLYDE